MRGSNTCQLWQFFGTPCKTKIILQYSPDMGMNHRSQFPPYFLLIINLTKIKRQVSGINNNNTIIIINNNNNNSNIILFLQLYFRLRKCCFKKKCWVQNIWGPNKILSQKNFGVQKFESQKIGVKKILGQKNSESKTYRVKKIC